MDNSAAFSSNIEPGTVVTVVFYMEDRPIVLAATVSEHDPLLLTTTEDRTEPLSEPRRAMLIVRTGEKFLKAEAEINCFKTEAPGWSIKLSEFSWEEVDRRRFPRHELEVEVSLRAVEEKNGEASFHDYHGTTSDLSLGGAWIKSEESVPSGTLVEFQAKLSPTESVRTLGIVAHSAGSKGGFGVEFLDYVGGARFQLHSYLSQAA